MGTNQGPYETRFLTVNLDLKWAALQEDFQLMLGGGYRLLDKETAKRNKPVKVDALAGLRYHYLKQELDVTGPLGTTPVGGSENWVEPYIGGRAMIDLTDKWSLGITGDIGGFGIGTASDLTWELLGGFEYRFNQRVAGQFGYKYYDIDYSWGSGSSEFGMDGNIHGLYMALMFNW